MTIDTDINDVQALLHDGGIEVDIFGDASVCLFTSQSVVGSLPSVIDATYVFLPVVLARERMIMLKSVGLPEKAMEPLASASFGMSRDET